MHYSKFCVSGFMAKKKMTMLHNISLEMQLQLFRNLI